MNDKDRAWKVCKILFCELAQEPRTSMEHIQCENSLPIIAAALSEAREEGKREALSDEIRTGAQVMANITEEMRKAKTKEAIEKIKAKAYADGRRAGLEEASKVAEKGLSQPGDAIYCDDPRDVKWEELARHIAKKIRALKEPKP